MTNEQSYYEYNPDEGSGWWKKESPVADPSFQKGLTELAGMNPFGKPNLRVEWAGKLLHDITEQPQLKYKITANVTTGYYYEKADGTIGTTASKGDAIDAAPNGFYVPKKEQIPVGRLRWVIEQWESAESLREKGRFTRLYDDTGQKVLRSLPPEGVYNHFFWVQTADRKYRDLDNQVLTAVQAMYLYNVTNTEAQKTLDDIERDNNRTLIGAAEARNIWAEMGQG